MTEVPNPNRLDGHPRMICLVCGYVLDYYDGPNGTGYEHSIGTIETGKADHPAIPVTPHEAPEQVVEKCDFCYAEDTSWVVPARTFQMPNQPSVSVGDWAACEMCGQLIAKDRWNEVHRRAKAGYEAINGPMDSITETALRAMHRKLRKNISGSIYRGQPQ